MTAKQLVAILGFALLISLPVLLVAIPAGPQPSLALVPVGLVLLYSSVRLATIASSGTQQIVTTTFWLFVYIFLGVCPLIQVSYETFPWPGVYGTPLLVKTGFIVLVGLWAFDAGHYLLRPLRGFAVPKALQRPLNKKTIVIVGLLSLLLAVFFLQKLGGMTVIFLARSQRGRMLSSQFGSPELLIFNQLSKTPVYTVAIAALVVWIVGRGRGRKVGFMWKGLTSILVAITLVLDNPISTARLMVGTVLLSLFFVLPWRRWSSALTVAGLVLTLLVVFPFADLFRNSLDASFDARLAKTSVLEQFAKNGDFDAFQMTANGASVMETSDYKLGRQLAGAFLFWVPRSVWPDKPVPTGVWIAKQVGYQFTNLSSPLWIEFYVDGGWLLLVVGFVGYGYLVRTLDRWYASSRVRKARVIEVLVPVYAGYQIFLLRGPLMPAVAYLSPILLFTLLCSIRPPIRGFRRRRSSRSVGAISFMSR